MAYCKICCLIDFIYIVFLPIPVASSKHKVWIEKVKFSVFLVLKQEALEINTYVIPRD